MAFKVWLPRFSVGTLAANASQGSAVIDRVQRDAGKVGSQVWARLFGMYSDTWPYLLLSIPSEEIGLPSGTDFTIGPKCDIWALFYSESECCLDSWFSEPFRQRL